MTLRGLVTGAICAAVCMGVFASDAAYAAKARKAVCEPALPGKICPPLQTSKCAPCKMKNGAPGCAWSACGPMLR